MKFKREFLPLAERQEAADQKFSPRFTMVVRNGIGLPIEFVRDMERAGVPLPKGWEEKRI